MTSRTTRYRWLAGAFALVVATALVTTQVVSDDKDPQGQKLDPEKQKLMEQYAKFAEPGPQHRQLATRTGAWDVITKCQMDPSAPPTETRGIAKARTVLGGRWVIEEFEGELPGMGPFSGIGITGYDNVKKKYVNFWLDTMGTGAMISEGTADPSGKIVTYTGSFEDPVLGKTKTVRSVAKFDSDSRHTFEMFDTAPDGKEFKSLDIVYTRK
jgi:uncharacterized protein DUF1579